MSHRRSTQMQDKAEKKKAGNETVSLTIDGELLRFMLVGGKSRHSFLPLPIG